jgi:hypothetical protein
MELNNDKISTNVSHKARDLMETLVSRGAYKSLSEIGREAIFDFLNECLAGLETPWGDVASDNRPPKVAHGDLPAGDIQTGRSAAQIVIYIPRSAREALERLKQSGEIKNLGVGGRTAIYALLEKIIEFNRDRHWHARRTSENELGLSR